MEKVKETEIEEETETSNSSFLYKSCKRCNGLGTLLTSPQKIVVYCPECIKRRICGKCGYPTIKYNRKTYNNYDSWNCSECGWEV